MNCFRRGLLGLQLIFIFLPWAAFADLPIHATLKDIKGIWTFYLTPPVTGAIHTCGSGAPNRNTENLDSSVADSEIYLKRHGGVSSTLELHLADDTVPYGEIRDISENRHRASWRILAVKDPQSSQVLGGWTTVYDEGFEVGLRDKTRLMAFMKYSKNDSCPAARDGDLEDANGRTLCYTTDSNRTQLGWYTRTGQDGTVTSGCFYGEKKGAPSPSSFVYVRRTNSEKEKNEGGDGTSAFSYYISKEFVDKHNDKLTSTWKAAYDSAFVQQHRQIFSSLIKDFGYSKVNSIDGVEAMPSFLQGEGGAADTVSSQLYACPCKAGEVVQDTRASRDVDADRPSPVLSPISMLQSTTSTADVKHHEQGGPAAAAAAAGAAAGAATAGVSAPSSSELPKSFAWPNPFTHSDFKEKGTNQGGCGSCYAIAAVYALERRFDIKASQLLGRDVSFFSDLNEKEQTLFPSFIQRGHNKLSPQSVLSCSFYNQGCHGGFPYLVGKHATELGVLQENCMPYIAMEGMACPVLHRAGQGGGPPSQANGGAPPSFLSVHGNAGSCSAGDKRWFAKDYGYVGGCYECGQCSGEEKIQREIYFNGPVTAAFDAPASLFAYTDGVYDTAGMPHSRVCDNPGAPGTFNGLNGWEFTNHAVNIVGWGETEEREGRDKQKYWIIRNTWGPEWGRGGYFLLARGKNAGGIESQVSFVDPDFDRGMGREIINYIKGNKL